MLARAARLLPVVVCAVMGITVLAMQGWSLVDDAYISFRYTANFAAGRGLVWNPGEPVEGYTNLLWVVLLAPFARLGLDLVIPSAVLSCLFACGCVGLLGHISRKIWPERPLVQMFPGLALATNPTFAYWSCMGMEEPAFAFFALLGTHLLVLGRKEDKRLSYSVRAGLVFAALALTRPEGIMVTGVLLLVEVLTTAGPWRSRIVPLLPVCAIVVGTVATQLVFRVLYYGDVLPNTFYAKVVLGTTSVGRGAAHVAAFLLKGGFVVIPGLLALRTRGSLRPYLLHGYALLSAYLVYLVVIGGDVPFWYRFYVPLLPLPLLGCAEVIAWLERALGRAPWLAGRPRRRNVAFATLGLLALSLSARLVWPHVETSTIDWMRLGGVYKKLLIRHFFRWHAPQDSFVAAWAVGMLGYYTPYRILDGWGLNDRTIARHPVPLGHRPFMFGHEKQHFAYVLSTLPDFIVLPIPGRLRPKLAGYDLCWPSWFDANLAIYRRATPLGERQRTLGMPTHMRRTLLLPPPCQVPLLPFKGESRRGRTPP